MTNKKKIFIILIILFLMEGFVISLCFKKEVKQKNTEKGNSVLLADKKEDEDNILSSYKYCNSFPKRRRPDYLPKLNEKSAIAIFFDQQGAKKILYQKNIEKKLPIASLTKMMTAMIVIDNYNLDKIVKISKKAIATPEETGRLTPGEKISIKGLLKICLLVSSNDAAAALAEVMGEEKFVELMNDKAEEIGLEDTCFFDPHGLDSRNVSSSKDLALLTQYSIINYPEIWQILGKNQEIIKSSNHLGQSINHWAQNTNKLIGEDYVLGGKTGYTDEAGDAMILAIEAPGLADGNVILVLLGLGTAERISRTKNLYDWVLWGWNWGDF